jgi:hypothetical protein
VDRQAQPVSGVVTTGSLSDPLAFIPFPPRQRASNAPPGPCDCGAGRGFLIKEVIVQKHGRSPAKIRGEQFSSNAAIERRCREIISSYSDGEMMSEDHSLFMLELILVRHESPHEKIIPGLEHEIEGVRVRHSSGHSLFGGSKTNVNHTFVAYSGGNEIDFSWKKCCSGFKKESQATQAMRRAVANQVADYKRWRYASGSGSVTSDASGSPLAWRDANVDHYPITFASLRDAFLSQEGLTLADVETRSDAVCGVAIKDKTLEEKWSLFHMANKTLRLVSAKENAASWREEGAIRNGF